MRDASRAYHAAAGRNALVVASLLSACAGQVLGSGDDEAPSEGNGATDLLSPENDNASTGNEDTGRGSGSGRGGSNSASRDPAPSGEGGDGASGPALADSPCEVQELLATKCQTCHAVDPPGSLLTPSDFSASSYSSPELTVAEEALRRLTLDAQERMPPPPYSLSERELTVLEAWLEAGAPATDCDELVEPSPSPYDTPTVCTSEVYWLGGADELMHPGMACLTCHQGNGGPDVAAAGTVYPTPHEPDDCHGASDATGAAVVITGSDGTEHVLPINAAGNFLLDASIALPYRAKVVHQGRERVMLQPQESGDCNSCHSESGAKGAPGRIFLP